MYKTDFSNNVCGCCGGSNFTNYHDCLSCRSRGQQCVACKLRSLADARQLLAMAHLNDGSRDTLQAYNTVLRLTEDTQRQATLNHYQNVLAQAQEAAI